MEKKIHGFTEDQHIPSKNDKRPVLKIYTRRGDTGWTDLADGQRVPKTDPRIACVGGLDELCSYVGLIVSLIPEKCQKVLAEEIRLIIQSQRFFFALGAWAAAVRKPQGLPQTADVEDLETAVNCMTESLGSAFNGFVLPGGHPAAAHIHVARTICRRTERLLLEAGAADWEEGDNSLPYLNRFSDFLYVLAKKINKMTGFTENKW